MIVCQSDINKHQFTVVLEDETCDDVHGRTEIEIFKDIQKGIDENDEQVLASIITTGLLKTWY